MRTKNLLKLAFTMLAMVVMTGAMAQTNTGATQWGANQEVGDFDRSNATPWNLPADVTFGDKVTVGKTMPFWVWPSAVYNPDYNYVTANVAFATQADIENNVTSAFAWQTGIDFAGLGAVGGFTKNYVEISWAVAEADLPATRLIEVIETPAAASCPADPVYFGVTVIDEPMVRFTSAGTTEVGVPNVIAFGCEGSTDVNVAATALTVALDNGDELPIGSGVGEAPYHINATYAVYTCDIDGSTGDLDWTNRSAALAAPSITKLGQDGTSAISQANPIVATSTTVFTGEDYTLESSKATVYEFTLVDWNAGISRKSDYLALDATSTYGDYSYYSRNSNATPALVNRIVVLPTPVTGPIYHIANDWSL